MAVADAPAATVVVFTCNHCPYALAWHDRIQAVARDYAGRAVRVLQICSNDPDRYPRDAPDAMVARVEAGEFAGPFLHDASQEVARGCGATVTLDVFGSTATSASRTAARRTPITGTSRSPPDRPRSALDAVLAGEPVAWPETDPVGCSISGGRDASPQVGSRPCATGHSGRPASRSARSAWAPRGSGPGATATTTSPIRIIHRALDAGVNFVDTADVYAGGESEEIVGKALRGLRDDVVLATKFHGPMADDRNRRRNSRRWIVRAVEDSLRRLDTDWIDLYQVHRPEPGTDVDETLGALTDLVRAGKVRYLGSSTFPAARDRGRRNGPRSGAAASASCASSRPTRCSCAVSRPTSCRSAAATAWA